MSLVITKKEKLNATKLENSLVEIGFLYRISSSLNTFSDLESVMKFFLNESVNVCHSGIGILWFYDRARKKIVVREQIGLQEKEAKKLKIFVGKIANDINPKDINNIENKILRTLIFRKYNVQSSLFFPVVASNKIICFFQLARLNDLPFSFDEKRLLIVLIKNFSMSFEKIRSQEKLSKNIKEIRSSRRKLQIEKKKLESILESIGDGAVVVNLHGVIHFFNPVASDLSAFDEKEALGKHYKKIIKFVSEKERVENYGHIENALIKGEISHNVNHTLLVTKTGQEISIDSSASPIKDAKGNVRGCIILFRDVSRGREIIKMKDDFISLASHQLRTPLTSLRWSLELLVNEHAGKLNISDNQKRILKDGYKSVLLLTDLVNSLLNVARAESDFLEVKSSRINIVNFCKKEMQQVLPFIRVKKQTFVFQKKLKNLEIYTDEQILHEVLLNLLSNAIRYTPNKGKIVLALEEDREVIVIKVKDNGLGVPKGQQKQIFQKFFRASNVLKVDTSGTGLGLAISRNLVELLGGEIWFQSSEGEGSTFCFSLPRKIQD